MKFGITVYDNAFSPEECEKYIDHIKKLQDRSLLFDGQLGSDRHQIDHQIYNFSHNYDLQVWSWLGGSFFPGVKKCVAAYMDEYSIIKKQKYLFHDLKVKKIEPGGGFHNWHFENASLISATRSIVVQLYLNTIDEGGETEFLYANQRVNAVQGRVIVFPAGYVHTHRGNPPIGQTKYIATTWGVMQG